MTIDPTPPERRARTLVFAALTTVLLACPASAQADAQAAFEAARVRFEAGNYTAARDMLLQASRTDARNAEVFLWLGRVHHLLGDVDAAVEAWQRTLSLAPGEPYATAMLAIVRGGTAGRGEAQLRLIADLVRERLLSAAARECTELLQDHALTAEQRTTGMRLQARILLGNGQVDDALAQIRRVLLRNDAIAGQPTTLVLQARALLRAGETSRGLALLASVRTDHVGTPAAAAAELVELEHHLGQEPTEERTQALRGWIEKHGDDDRIDAARSMLLEAFVRRDERSAPPRWDTPIGEDVKSALDVADDLYGSRGPSGGHRLTERLRKFLESRYGRNGAFAAMAEGAELLAQRPLARADRRAVLAVLARARGEVAIRALTASAKAGALDDVADTSIPTELQAAVGALQRINTEFPAQPVWGEQVSLAERVRQLAEHVSWPAQVTGPRPPSSWALEIALPVVSGGARDASVAALATVGRVVDGLMRESPAVALVVQDRLLTQTPLEHPGWQAAMIRRVELLDHIAITLFEEHERTGQRDPNRSVQDPTRQLVATLSGLVARDAAESDGARQRLAAHLARWVERGYLEAAVQSWQSLRAALPPSGQRHVQLAVAKLRIDAVLQEHARLAATGLAIPRKLDPRHAQALQSLCLLLDEQDQGDFTNEVRTAWTRVVAHYRGLEYDDIAQQAIAVRGDRDVAAANEHAELASADLSTALAERSLRRLLERHRIGQLVELTPSFRTALDAWLAFLTSHPTSKRSADAVRGAERIAMRLARHGGHLAAATVWSELAATTARLPLGSRIGSDGVKLPEQAEIKGAAALHAHARHSLAERRRSAPSSSPPTQLDATFDDAIAAYRRFITAHPDSQLVGDAIHGILTVGLEHARIAAFRVAEDVFADLASLPTGKPERFEFCRGLCKLGPAMPEHATRVLTALIEGKAEEKDPVAATQDALGNSKKESAARHNGPGGKTSGLADLVAPGAATGNSFEFRKFRAVEKPADDVLRTIRNQEAQRASRVAQLRDSTGMRTAGREGAFLPDPRSVLSPAEIARLREAMDAAYEVFVGILRSHAHSTTASLARAQVLVMIDHWRSLAQWEESTRLCERFLEDQPDDGALPQLRLEIARDYLALAASPLTERATKQDKLAKTLQRFDQARTALARIPRDFAYDRELAQRAQWDIATSWLTQARAVAAFSPTLARGQFVRASREIRKVAHAFHDHPNIAQVPELLWGIAEQSVAMNFFAEAVGVFGDLSVHYATHPRAAQAHLQIAQLYQNNLRQPLRAAEAYQELNYTRGGNDIAMQNAIFQIGLQLQAERRWVEALHVLETFVDSFPTHPNAGQALTLLGHIHQTNEAWEDAILAYGRVIADYEGGGFVKAARWSIAECVINLSRWDDAIRRYHEFIAAYPKDEQSTEAQKRIDILKDLARYQRVADEEGQRKAFDAQFQIATIVRDRLGNPVKAVLEFGRVRQKWPSSHLADDALFETGSTLLTLGKTKRAREAFTAVAAEYPSSPLADDALYLVGKSYENEAAALATVTRAESGKKAKEVAQRAAYSRVQSGRRALRDGRAERIADLKQKGQFEEAANEEASVAALSGTFASANVSLFAQWATQEAAAISVAQLADRQDKVDAALRKAVAAYEAASKVAAGDKAGDALLAMAKIHDEKLDDAKAAMATWLEIVRQFSGTAVAENASWRIARYHEQAKGHVEAIEAYKAFLRNYRRSKQAGNAQIAIAENYEQLGQWVNAMDAYTNYMNNFGAGPLVNKAREQIRWIKTYRL